MVTVPGARATAPTSAAPGEDIRAGDTVLRARHRAGPGGAGRAGQHRPHHGALCARAPRVALLTTGDELTAAGQRRCRPAASTAPTARRWPRWCRTPAAEVVLAEDVPDTADGTRVGARPRRWRRPTWCACRAGCRWARTTTSRARSPTWAWRSASGAWRCKPGKPTWFGTAGAKLGFGLPGNPVSAHGHLPAVRAPGAAGAAGRRSRRSRGSPARLTAPVAPEAGRTNAVRCLLRAGAEGWELTPTGPQGSHQLTSMLAAGRAGADRARARTSWPPAPGSAPSCCREYRLRTVRERDPRRVLGRRREARARVKIIDVPESEAPPDGSVTHQAGGRGHAAPVRARPDLERRVPGAPGPHLLALPHARVAGDPARGLHRRGPRGVRVRPAVHAADLPPARLRDRGRLRRR